MLKESPILGYYKPKEGHWSGRLRLEVTDPERLKTANFLARQSVTNLARISQSFSPPMMTTSVNCSGLSANNEVVHTTLLTNFGMPLYRSKERIRPELDGRSFRLVGHEQYFPFWGKPSLWLANGAVETDYNGAVYYIPWLGVTMEQRTRMTEAGLEIVQTTPFSRAVVLLIHKGPLNAEIR